MKLSLQEKLALIMTSAGSQRNLAAFLGVSHQRVGRWLREGEEGGVKQIPPEAREAIDNLFQIHAEVAREQAAYDKVKVNYRAPVYMKRLPLRTGEMGQRVIAQNTEFIRAELRTKVIVEAQRSKQFYGMSVRSTINISDYNKQADNRLRSIRRSSTQDAYKRELHKVERERRKLQKRFGIGDFLLPIYTRAEGIGRNTQGERAAIGINKMLRQKHEPATGEKGTHLADMFLFQMTLPPKKPAKKPKQGEHSKAQARTSPEKLSRRADKAKGKFRK